MKKIILSAVLFVFNLLAAQEAEVKKSIQVFFEGLHTADTLKMKSVCADAMVFHSSAESPKGNRFTAENPKEFYKSVSQIPKNMKVEERLLDYKIQIDGSMAHAWTPYEFYINGKLSHKGVNSFQLYNDNGQWKIVYVMDTRRK